MTDAQIERALACLTTIAARLDEIAEAQSKAEAGRDYRAEILHTYLADLSESIGASHASQ